MKIRAERVIMRLMSPYLERSFLAVQRCLVPRSAAFSEAQQNESLRIIRSFLDSKPAAVQFRLSLFFRIIDLFSFFYGGRSFSGLSPEKQTRVLHGLFDSGISLFRKGFWGINTLARMGVYGQPSIYPDLSYRLKPLSHDRTDA